MSFDEKEFTEPYGVRLVEELRNGKRTWFAEHPKLPGCHAVADTDTEAMRRLADARTTWLSWAEDVGFPVPEPDENYSVTVQFAVPAHSPKARSVSETEVQNVKLVAA